MHEQSWRKSSYSADNGCFQMADLGGDMVGLRDSKDPDGPVLRLTRGQVADLVAGVKAGHFDHLS